MNETLSEMATYTWITRYECIQTSSPFNKFLDTFKSGYSYPGIEEFEGVCYRFLRAGTSSKSNPVKLYKQYVIGNNFSVYRLGVNGCPNLDMGMNARTRAKRFPPPINKWFSIASLFWANKLLKTQKAW